MQNFYVILDYEQSRFAINGFYVTVKEIKEKGYRDPTDDGMPKNDDNSSKIVWAIIIAIVAVLVVIAIAGFVIVRLKNRRLQNNLAKYEQL